MLDCPVCLEEFNEDKRRPKSLPCGHTFCSHCLGDMLPQSCPHCRMDFWDPASSLPDNLAILGLVEKQRAVAAKPRGSPVSARKLWCVDCCCAATDPDACLDLGHTLCSLRKVLLDRAAPKLKELGDATAVAQKAVETLEKAKDAVDILLLEWRVRLQQIELAERELRAAVDGPGDLKLEAGPGLEQVQQAASLLEAEATGFRLRHRDGSEWAADLGGGRSLLDALVLDLHHHGRLSKNQGQLERPAAKAAPDCIEHIDLKDASSSAEGERAVEKLEKLALVRQHGVRKMRYLFCGRDPVWALDMLRSAAPTLQELDLKTVRKEHLEAAHAMPGLRRLSLSFDGTRGFKIPVLPPLPLGGGPSALQVWAWQQSRSDLDTLLRSYSASLQELWLQVGTPGRGQWPKGPDGLDTLLDQCGLLRLSRIVLLRQGVDHSSAVCPAQLSAVQRAFPAAKVLCQTCGSVEFRKFWRPLSPLSTQKEE